MKSRILLAAFALLAASGVARADNFSTFYGNTVNFVGADGSKTTAYVNADMTWERHDATGAVVKGTYVWKDATTACFTQTDPAPAASASALCLPNQVARNVGDSWSSTGADGKPVTISLTAGR